VQAVGWRGLFAVLGALSALAALLFLVVVPDCPLPTPPATTSRQPMSLMRIYSDRRFWRLAPLSAIGVGTSWSLQGLWAATWFRDVDGLDRAGVVQTLTIIAMAVSASGLVLGLAADRLRRVGVKTERVLTGTFGLSMVAQLALVLEWPVPSCIAWIAIAAAGAATVLSYAILVVYFPKQASGRANAALNLLHVGAAFLLQSVSGLLIEQWPSASGRYPIDAHQTAMAVGLLLQVGAPFLVRALDAARDSFDNDPLASRPSVTAHRQAIPLTSLASPAPAWALHSDLAGKQAVVGGSRR
jgi:predicted MFS family arabinose efflux permease